MIFAKIPYCLQIIKSTCPSLTWLFIFWIQLGKLDQRSIIFIDLQNLCCFAVHVPNSAICDVKVVSTRWSRAVIISDNMVFHNTLTFIFCNPKQILIFSFLYFVVCAVNAWASHVVKETRNAWMPRFPSRTTSWPSRLMSKSQQTCSPCQGHLHLRSPSTGTSILQTHTQVVQMWHRSGDLILTLELVEIMQWSLC